MHIFYKHRPDLYIVDCLSCHNDTENEDQETAGMSITIHTLRMGIGIQVCMSIEDIRTAMHIDKELQMPQTHIIRGWLQNRDDLEHSLGRY